MDQIFGNLEEVPNSGAQNIPNHEKNPNLGNLLNEPQIQLVQEYPANINYNQQQAFPADYQIDQIPDYEQHDQQYISGDQDQVQPPSEPLRSQSDQQQDFNVFGNEMGNNEGGGPFFGAHLDPYSNVFSSQPLMDEEQRMLLQAVEQRQQERLMVLAQKDRQQMKFKEEKRQKAQQQLSNWNVQRHKDIERKMQMNYKAEQNFRELQQSYKSKPNPWEKVVDNVEIKASNYAGTKDVNRLRSSILNKKADFGKLQ